MVTRGGKEGREREREEWVVGGGVAGRAGDFARRVIVKLSSIYFTNLHITSAVVAASQKEGTKWVDGGNGCNETSVLGDVRTYVSTCT